MRRAPGVFIIAAVILVGSALVACERETRRVRESPPSSSPTPLSQTQAGGTAVLADTHYEENAFAMAEGKRLYTWFNCVGCHAHGGGDIGPPLMDDQWIYGGDSASIFTSIVEGRPNGMPSFRTKIPDQQVWQIVAYVRSLSGRVRSDAAPGRRDSMSA